VMSLGMPSAENSKNTSAVCPSPISRSNNTTARLIQKTATSTREKNPKSTRSCDSMYLSNFATHSPQVMCVHCLLNTKPSIAQGKLLSGFFVITALRPSRLRRIFASRWKKQTKNRTKTCVNLHNSLTNLSKLI
jgi:hypothetical protein